MKIKITLLSLIVLLAGFALYASDNVSASESSSSRATPPTPPTPPGTEENEPVGGGGGGGLGWNFSDFASPEYRKVSLNGFPMKDEKPQEEAEDDYVDEETYIDAYNLQLTHRVTDVYVKIPTSELSLSVRRNNKQEIIAPGDEIFAYKLSQGAYPFGPGWGTNIVSYAERVDVTGKATTRMTVYDETGGAHSFIEYYIAQTDPETGEQSLTTRFMPSPSGSDDTDSLHASLGYENGKLVLEKQNGICVIYQPASQFIRYYHQVQKKINRHNFWKAEYITDRYGNRVDYVYNTPSLIPNKINYTIDGNTKGITIHSAGGKVNKVVDPRGNQVVYEYIGNNLRKVYPLHASTDTDPAFKSYSYGGGKVLPDLTIRTSLKKLSSYKLNKEHAYTYIWLSSITDENLNTYTFSYVQDMSVWVYSSSEDNKGKVPNAIVNGLFQTVPGRALSLKKGYYNAPGRPFLINTIQLPNNTTASVNVSGNYNSPNARGIYVNGLIHTLLGNSLTPFIRRFTDTNGAVHTYTFSGSKLTRLPDNPGGFSTNDPHDDIYSLNYSALTIKPGSTNSMYDEQYVFNSSAGYNIASIDDYSGNTTTYENKDRWHYSKAGLHAFFASTLYNGNLFMRDPTAETDPLGNRTEYKYVDSYYYENPLGLTGSDLSDLNDMLFEPGVPGEGKWRVMSMIIEKDDSDTIIRTTKYKIDRFGRRRSEEVKDPSGTVVKHTEFEYGHATFKNFMTAKRVTLYETDAYEFLDSVGGVSTASAIDTLTEYVPDEFGNVKFEKVYTNNSDYLTTEYEYDPNNNKTKVIEPGVNNDTNQITPATTFQYDARNRLQNILYNQVNNLLSADIGTSATDNYNSEKGYDDRSNKVYSIDQNGNRTLYFYDDLNRLLKTVQQKTTGTVPDIQDALDHIDDDYPHTESQPNQDYIVTVNVYNELNSLVQTIDPNGNVTDFYYDELQRLVLKIDPAVQNLEPQLNNQSVNPDTIATSRPTTIYYYEPSKNTGSGAFDSNGFRPTTIIDPRGYVVTSVYDGNYRKVVSAQSYQTPLTIDSSYINSLIDDTKGHFASTTDLDPTDLGIPSFSLATASAVAGYAVTRTEYDALDRPIIVTQYRDNPGGDPDVQVTLTEYDELDQVIATARTIGTLPSNLNSITNQNLESLRNNSSFAVTSNKYTSTQFIYETTDAEGNTTNMAYDAAGRLVAKVDPPVPHLDLVQGTITPLALVSISNIALDQGLTAERPLTITEYDPNGNVTKTINPRGEIWEFQFDALNRSVIGKQPTVYDEENQTAGAIPITITQYDGVGNVTGIKDPRGNVTQSRYDAAYRLTEVEGPLVDAPSIYDLINGVDLSASVDQANALTITTYDNNSNPTLVSMTVSDGSDSRFLAQYDTFNVYDAPNRLTATVLFPQNGVADINVSLNTLSDDNDNYKIVRNAYDANNNRSLVIDGNGNPTLFLYDGLNRNTAIQYSDVTVGDASNGGAIKTMNYDAFTQTSRVDEKGQTTNYHYDAGFRLSTVDYQDGAVTAASVGAYDRFYTYDKMDNILQVDEPDNQASDVRLVQYQYDALYRQVAELSAGQVHQYAYDLAGNRTLTIYGHRDDAATYSTVDGTFSLTHAPDKRILFSTYDALNRLSTMYEGLQSEFATALQSGLTTSYRNTTYRYDLNGNIWHKTLGNGDVVSCTYDSMNRKITSETTTEIMESVIDPQFGNTVTFQRKHNRFTNLYDLASNVIAIKEEYQPGKFGSANISNRTIINEYDGSFRLLAERIQKQKVSYDVLEEWAIHTVYDYDDGDNRIARQIISTGYVPPEQEKDEQSTYTFNELNQIQTYTETDNLAGESETTTYAYDANGNRSRKTYPGYESQTELGGGGYGEVYTYDYENRLYEFALIKQDPTTTPAHILPLHFFTIWRYEYDYRTRRVQHCLFNGGGAFALVDNSYSGGLRVQEHATSSFWSIQITNAPTVEYIRGSDYGGGIGGLLYSIRHRGSLQTSTSLGTSFTPPRYRYNHYDARGDIIGQSDETQTLTWQASYEAFGTHGKDTKGVDNKDHPGGESWGENLDRQRANTKYEDLTGLLNEGFRYRDLDAGVFLQRDPLGMVDGPNLYTYVNQNPWTYFDPLGLEKKKEEKKKKQKEQKQTENANDGAKTDVNTESSQKYEGVSVESEKKIDTIIEVDVKKDIQDKIETAVETLTKPLLDATNANTNTGQALRDAISATGGTTGTYDANFGIEDGHASMTGTSGILFGGIPVEASTTVSVDYAASVSANLSVQTQVVDNQAVSEFSGNAQANLQATATVKSQVSVAKIPLLTSSKKLDVSTTVTTKVAPFSLPRPSTPSSINLPSGSFCFAAGTKITLFSGETVNIENIKVGDIVLSWDEENNILTKGKVVELFSPKHHEMVVLEFNNGTKTINTADHPFYIEGKGWSSIMPELTKSRYPVFKGVDVLRLMINDSAFYLQGTKLEQVKLKTVSIVEEDTQTYNFRVSNTHTYFANGILVHNK